MNKAVTSDRLEGEAVVPGNEQRPTSKRLLNNEQKETHK